MIYILSSIFIVGIFGIYSYFLYLENKEFKIEINSLNRIIDLISDISKEEVLEKRIQQKLNKIKDRDLERAYKIIDGAKKFIKKITK